MPYILLYLLKDLKHSPPAILYIRESIYLNAFSLLIPSSFPKVIEVNGVMVNELKLRRWPAAIIAFISFIQCISLRKASIVIAVSEQIRLSLIKRYALNSDDVHVVPNGVNLRRFTLMDRSAAFRKIGLDPNLRYIGYVGGLTEWQNLGLMIKATTFVVQKAKDVKLLIIGTGRTRKHLEDIVKKEGLDKSVFFIEGVCYEKVPFYMNVLEVGLMPDKRMVENRLLSSPLKMWEYLACGIPVLTFSIPEISFIAKNNVGKFVAKDNITDIANKIMSILKEKDKEKIRDKARKLATKHSWEETGQMIMKLLPPIEKR